MIRQTSLESFRKLKEEGTLSKHQLIVLNAFREYGRATDREITNLLGINDPNVVRPRRNELVSLGFLEEDGKDFCMITGRKAIVWCPTGVIHNGC